MKEGWARQRWWEFRQGHSTYLIFVLTFINFVLIAYRLLIEKVSFFKQLVPELWIFIVLFLGIYIPASILIGYWHRRTQLSVEATMKKMEDPLFAKMIRIILDVQTGKATKEEIEKFRELLIDIEKKLET